MVVPFVIVAIFRKDIFGAVLKPSQDKIIAHLHEKYRDKFRQFIDAVEKETKYNIIITVGYISWLDQQKLHEKDPKNPKPGDSFNNYGLAINILATNSVTFLRKKSSQADWDKSGIPKIAEKFGIKQNSDNLANFYVDGYSIDALKKIAISQYGSDVALIKGNEIKLPPIALRRLNVK